MYKRLVGPQRRPGRCEEEKNRLPLPEIEPWPPSLSLYRLSSSGCTKEDKESTNNNVYMEHTYDFSFSTDVLPCEQVTYMTLFCVFQFMTLRKKRQHYCIHNPGRRCVELNQTYLKVLQTRKSF
jgi:hypothetical protein